MDQDRVEMQERGLDILSRNGGFCFDRPFFPYTSGKVGPYLVQSEAVMGNGPDYDQACEDMVDLVVGEHSQIPYDFVAGGQSRDWIFSGHVARDTQKPHLMIYKDGRLVGYDKFVCKNAALVCDLNREGSSPRDLWVPAIRKAGGKVTDIFFYVDRLEEGGKVMRELGLRSEAVVPLDEHAWDYLQRNGTVSSEEYQRVFEWKQDKDAWASQMLTSPTGLEELTRLSSGDFNSRAKAEKIILEGYPELDLMSLL